MFQKVAILVPFKKNGYFDPLTFGPLLISWFWWRLWQFLSLWWCKLAWG